jgi:hypothetical protein
MQLWSKGGQLLAIEVGIIGMWNARIMASTQISKEGLGGQTTCGRVRVPAGSP